MPREDRDMGTERERERDLVLNPRQYAYILDLTKGHVNVYVGPHKTSLANTDRPVRYSPESRRFEECRLEEAIRDFPAADEGSYIVLENPAEDKNEHPNPGPNSMARLNYGRKVNIPGPITFPLWPGQVAQVIPGHNLRSNQYLLVRVYNEEAAKANWSKAIVKKVSTEKDEGSKSEVPELITGQLLIIKGTEVSFYIPPTGIEVVPDEMGNYTRTAVTLERLEYCILLDENGNKRYVRGPDVVFPSPTETFVQKGGSRKFMAIELSELSGLYIKVIAPYEENGRKYTEGEELFITGKDQMIYFPRPEHSIIRYGNQTIHYAVAIPEGEARYVLNKQTGQISLVKGPQMFLPDPRKEVIVRRVLSPTLCELLYPGNTEALEYNKKLAGILSQQKGSDFLTERTIQEVVTTESRRGMGDTTNVFPTSNAPNVIPAQKLVQAWEIVEEDRADIAQGAELPPPSARTARIMRQEAQYAEGYSGRAQAAQSRPATIPPPSPPPPPYDLARDDFKRKTTYSPPQTMVLNTKYEGAVSINVWTGYAVMLVSKSGKRRVIIGPCTALLEYDEVPQILELSTGTPKTDKQIIKTAYLRVRNNKVSDIVEAVTKDMVHVAVKLAYRINFEEEDKPEKWFNVENYINFLCDHTRSLIRNAAKGYGIDEFNQNAINIIRDTVLGKQGPEGKRPGRKFEENGMRIYDIEVLDITIGDETIGNMLVESQHKAVQQAIMLAQKEKELQDTQRIEKITQDIEAARAETESKRYALQTQKLEQELKVKLAEVELDTKVQTERIKAEEAQQELLDRIHEAELARQKLSEDQRLALVEREQKVKLEMMDAEAKAVVQKASAVTPQMVAALQSFGDKVFVEKLMAALGPHALLRGNSVADVFAQLVNSTPEIGGKLKDLLSLLPGNAGFPKEAAK